MSAWQHILGVAAVGTERQEVTLPPTDSTLDRALGGLDVSDREGALLGAVALAALHRLAGLRPAADSLPLNEVAEAEQSPRCGDAAGQHLALMLGGEFKEVLPEWLKTLHAAGRRVPEELLPALLDKGNVERELRPLILEVSGRRGLWLAAQNDAWGWAAAAAGPGEWETARRDERLSLLRALRETEPAKARELLASTWKSEAAKDRQALLQTFAVGLGEGDEPFLNEALQDRSADVRRWAGEILLRLPASQLSRLVTERVGPLLSYRKPLLGKARVEVNLPDDPEAWQRESRIPIEVPALTARTLGKKGWWLRHAVGWVPPGVWCGLWNKRPAEVLEAAHNGEWGEAIVEGLVVAARRQGDADWVEAILEHKRTHATAQGADAASAGLAARLPPARLEALLLKEIAGGRGGPRLDPTTILLLLEHRAEWSDALSRAVVAAVKGRVRESTKTELAEWQLKSALKQFALYVSHKLADELLDGWPAGAGEFWQRPIEEFQSVLSFRRDMRRAILKEEG